MKLLKPYLFTLLLGNCIAQHYSKLNLVKGMIAPFIVILMFYIKKSDSTQTKCGCILLQ